MSYAAAMIQSSPTQPKIDPSVLAGCIDACFACAQACTACADACLGEQDVQKMVRCIRLDLDCADICQATGRVLSRLTAFDATVARAALQACATACRQCGDECEQHGRHMEHCRVCAEACRQCEAACQQVLSALPA